MLVPERTVRIGLRTPFDPKNQPVNSFFVMVVLGHRSLEHYMGDFRAKGALVLPKKASLTVLLLRISDVLHNRGVFCSTLIGFEFSF